MSKSKTRSNYELKKITELSLDAGKIAFGTALVKFFESPLKMDTNTIVVISGCLFFFIGCVIVGLQIARKVKENE